MDILEGYLHKCPLCGNEFWARNEWVFKRRVGSKFVYFCTYHCWRQDEKDREEKKQAQRAARSEKLSERKKDGRCPFCRTAINPGDRFCHSCGREM